MTTAETNQDGSGGSSTGADGVGGEGGDGKVDFKTYDKVMGELKATKAELAKRTQADRDAQTKKDLDEKNYLSVIEKQKADLEALQTENETHKRDKTDFRKINAALGLLQEKGINIESQYLNLIPIDQIIVDANGNVDKTSVAKVVGDFQKQHPRIVLPANKILPTDRPGTVNKISVEEWRKLPDAEMEKALKEKRVDYDFGT